MTTALPRPPSGNPARLPEGVARFPPFRSRLRKPEKKGAAPDKRDIPSLSANRPET
jgi:hypothetical protein